MAGIAELDFPFELAFGGIAELDDDTGDDDTTKRVPIPLEAGAARGDGDTTPDRRLPASQTNGALAGAAGGIGDDVTTKPGNLGAGANGVGFDLGWEDLETRRTFGAAVGRTTLVSPNNVRSWELSTSKAISCQVNSAG